MEQRKGEKKRDIAPTIYRIFLFWSSKKEKEMPSTELPRKDPVM